MGYFKFSIEFIFFFFLFFSSNEFFMFILKNVGVNLNKKKKVYLVCIVLLSGIDRIDD